MRKVVYAALAGALAIHVQTSAQALKFDVTSVKQSPDPRTVGVVTMSPGAALPGGTWTATFATVPQMIRTLYPGHALPGQIVGGPPWLATNRFHIVAKTDPGRSPEEIRLMARELLAERFQLMTHFEMRELPVYLLVLARADGKLGPGLVPPAIDCDEYRAARARGEAIPAGQVRFGDRLPCVAADMRPSPSLTRLTAGGTTIGGFLTLLGNQLGRPVVDRTGLTQPFDIELQFDRRPLNAGDPPADQGPTIFRAIQDQLGLKLEEGRAPVEVIVIDRAELPSPD